MKSSYGEIIYSTFKRHDEHSDIPNYLTIVEADDEFTADYISQALKIKLLTTPTRIASAPNITLIFGSEHYPNKFFNEISV